MKLPGLYVLPPFCIGIIAAALHPFHGGSVAALAGVLFLGAAAMWRFHAGEYTLALALALAGWAALGAMAFTVEQRNRPANLASHLVENAQLDSSQPLRWRGVLRENPERLPVGRAV